MSDNFDDILTEYDDDDQAQKSKKRKRRNSSRRSSGNRRRTNGGQRDPGRTGGSGSGSSSRGASGGSSTGGTGAGSAAAGGTGAGSAAAGGTGAGSAAAGGAGAGSAAAGVAAVAWPVLLAIIIIVVIIIIILLIVGAVTFFQTVPGMMMDKITEISSNLWADFQGFFIGNVSQIDDKTQTKLAEYIENMGYDVVGYGFASTDDIKTQNDGGKTVKSKYLLSYLLADYNTYAVDEITFSDVYNYTTKYSLWGLLFGPMNSPPTGMLKFDDNHLIDETSVSIDRDTKTAKIKVWNPELKNLNLLNSDTYTYSLDGWTGRYGKPLEFLLTLHLSTMAPDLAYHVASDKEFDTKVHIDFMDLEAYLKLQYVVKAEAIQTIKAEDFSGVRIWDIDGLEYLENKVSAEGTLTLSETDLETIKDKLEGNLVTPGNPDVETAIQALGMSTTSLKDAVSFCNEHGGKGKQLLSKQPYITYVEKTWYKNIYFVINNDIKEAVSGDEWLKSQSDFNAYESQDLGSVEMAPYDFHPSSDSDQANIVSNTSKGTYQIIEHRQSVQISQKLQPLKGNTNPRIKELFVGAGNDNVEGTNPKPEYYIYDGTVETAAAIDELKKLENQHRESGSYTEAEISDFINKNDPKNLYREIDFNKNSLTALAILENMQTEDADFILRDFKKLLIELEYFTISDLKDKDVNSLDWIIPDYIPLDWPNRKYEKQNYEYGTYILSKKSIEKIKQEDSSTPTNERNSSNLSNQSSEDSKSNPEMPSKPGGSQVSTTGIEKGTESGDGYSSTTIVNGVTYRDYKQYAGTYAETSFWGGTIHTHGCGPTSAAIVASGYGKLEATPRVMADNIGTETTLQKVQSALDDYGITSTIQMVTNGETDEAAAGMRKCFSEGKPVLILMGETTNKPPRPAHQFSGGGHFIVLLGEKDGKLIMSNPGRGNEAGNTDSLGLEAFIRDYMSDYSTNVNRGYLIFDEAPDGSAVGSKGFEAGMKVITPGIGEVTKVSADSITIKFTETNLVKDMTMTIKGFTVDSSIAVGAMLEKEQEIGVTTDEDILVILQAPNKAVIENVEDYMPSPGTEEGTSAYYGDLTEDEFEFFATVLVAENGSNADTMAAVAQVIKNRALDTVHFHDVNTITDVLVAPGQYGCVYKVPGSGPGPIPNASGKGEATPPAGTRTFMLEGKGEYWVGNNYKPREATDESRQVAREVLDGTRPDVASAQMGKLALYQVTLNDYPNHDGCCVELGELYAHSWNCLTGKHQSDSCTLP